MMCPRDNPNLICIIYISIEDERQIDVVSATRRRIDN